MIETQQPFFSAPGLSMLVKPIGQAEEILRDYIDSGEFWILAVDGHGWPFAERIIERFYSDAEAEDMFAAVIPHEGLMVGVIVMRRTLMSARQYRFELSKAGIDLTARELVASGPVLHVAEHNATKARRFARGLGLSIKGDDLAVSE